jgi:hypothetical protein
VADTEPTTAAEKSPIRTMVERFMSMTATRRIAILNDVLGEGTVSWEDDNPVRWPDLLAQVRERGLIEQLRERVMTDGR